MNFYGRCNLDCFRSGIKIRSKEILDFILLQYLFELMSYYSHIRYKISQFA